MYPERPVSSWLSTTIESWGISTAFRVSRLIELWAKATKGTAKKARTINANILFIIYFPPIDKYAGSPSRGTLSTGSHTYIPPHVAQLLCRSRVRFGEVRVGEFNGEFSSAEFRSV